MWGRRGRERRCALTAVLFVSGLRRELDEALRVVAEREKQLVDQRRAFLEREQRSNKRAASLAVAKSAEVSVLRHELTRMRPTERVFDGGDFE